MDLVMHLRTIILKFIFWKSQENSLVKKSGIPKNIQLLKHLESWNLLLIVIILATYFNLWTLKVSANKKKRVCIIYKHQA